MSEMLRFFTVTVLGVVLDIGIAYGLHEIAGVSLALAAVMGFVCAASFNYVLHQLWSFQSGSRSLSLNRASKYGLVAGLTLLARVSVVAVLAEYLAGQYALLILICGAGVSFFVNFTLSKLFVFDDALSQERAS
ncbi:GtrA family protein [uncultured Erythrobacter sp.]|uniref:GtrA family protein n=1 Tax=uncultured Erythrobacter sp. TaxID=263913 RepID=UPI002604D7F0|nr:GtrA family protein [uncultured Erythrobacter sp.]